MNIKTVNRLITIANMVIKGKPVADIGADHALLTIYMLEKGLIPNAIVTDIIDGPYERAEEAIAASPYKDNVEVRKGDGIDIIKPHEVATIVIAGMGGDVIADIISRDWNKAESFERYILQPMSRPQVVRELLGRRGWQLNEERVVYENNKFFVILNYTPANTPYELTPLEAEIGIQLLNNDYEYKKGYLQSFLNKYAGIIRSLEKSSGTEEQILLKNYLDKAHRLEELLHEFTPS